MKKRLLSWFMAMVMVLGLLPVTAWAEEAESETESITVNVTIANKGELEIAHKAVTVVDQNESGTFDIDDALYAAHKEYYNGATSGYNSAIGDFGLGIIELWGDTSGSFGYYVNDGSAWSLTDEVKNGDKVVAFVYKNPDYSDQYSFFNNNKVSIEPKKEVALTLSYKYWDKDKYTTAAVSGATITVNGENTEIKTTTDGECKISFNKEDRYLISAVSDEMTIVPPVCVITVTDTPVPDSGTEEDEKQEDKDEETNQTSVEIDTLLENIAASYVNNSGEWVIMDMAAYEDLESDGPKTSDEAKQAYIKKAIESINKESVGETTYTKAILALTAIGVDAEELYPEGSKTEINAIEGLNGKTHSSSTWVAPYTLMAYGQGLNESTTEYENAVIQAVLKSQKEDGSWSSQWDKGVQSTANVIVGLAFYKDREGVAEAIAKAVDFLASNQRDDGKFYDYDYADANTEAMAIIGLCAAGVNPDTDERFVKNGVSALDALLSFTLEDGSGFGWKDSTTLNGGATEQAFRALIAASQVMKTGEAFNIYDFRHNADDLVPGYAVPVEEEEEIPADKPSEDDGITVEVSIKAISEYWLKNKSVTIEEDSTVYDAFMEAIDDTGIEQEGAKNGYIESMTYDGETLGEFDEGDNSGWLYKVNGELPDIGIKDYELEDGDKILLYYTQDWKKDPDAGSRYEEEEEEIPEEIVEEEALEEIQPEVQLPAIEKTYTDISTDAFYYEAAQWAVAKGIVSGVTDTEFGADWNCSRGQLMTFLWRMMGSPATETQTAPYIDVAKDMYYHDAILWATENDFANGTDGISFSPEMTLNRGQAVTFLWRAAGMPEPAGEIAFADVSESDYYWKAILWAAENGITSGTGEGIFSPEAPCTRGQIVTFLYRYFGK